MESTKKVTNSYYGLMKYAKIVIFPFCDETPLFFTDKFFRSLDFLKKKFKKEVVIFCFYLKDLYRKTLNALILRNKRVESIFGEGMTQKSGEFIIRNKTIKVLFYYDLYKKKETNFDFIIGLDDEKLSSLTITNMAQSSLSSDTKIHSLAKLCDSKNTYKKYKSKKLKKKREEASNSGVIEEEAKDFLSYQIDKFLGKVVFVFKNGEVVTSKNIKFIKKSKKVNDFYVQIFDKLVK